MSAYDKSFQQVPPPFMQKDGHVRIEFLSGDTLLFVIFNELRIFAKTGKSVIRI